MSAPASLTISYELAPPEGTQAPASGLKPSAVHAVDLATPAADGYKAYYDSLRAALAIARTKTGEELTEWRDAVRNRELKKEVKKSDEDEDEEEDEDEAEE
ncbi:hypothetical protein BV25DRAFT_1820555 [Artomyces pyxidatus]|uniref:Uncharacterized protein n=1 Tax=Artomyces pyxidatus TaxID=48021 RepID=A0ACB8TDT8_9AGAM|nr:hypothetical protein BV25DRAFT_1820555 [Artomyces pyxidatus]